VVSPRVDAELLTAHYLGVPRSRLFLIDEITESQAAELTELVKGRAERVPLQHLTGTAPFLGLDLRVGPGVFIPRPETELLAQWAIAVAGDLDSPVVVDLCGGSGALALAVATACPGAVVYAVERSPAALEWLRRNAKGTTVEVIAGDIRTVELDLSADLVISNPPYVPASTPVSPEVMADPAEAVFAGEDGLELIPAVIGRAAALLRPGGWLGFEHDDSHTGLAPLLRADFVDVVTHADLAGRPRYTTARRKACQTGTL
jgi:release factor glutamine methyltransferase